MSECEVDGVSSAVAAAVEDVDTVEKDAPVVAPECASSRDAANERGDDESGDEAVDTDDAEPSDASSAARSTLLPNESVVANMVVCTDAGGASSAEAALVVVFGPRSDAVGIISSVNEPSGHQRFRFTSSAGAFSQ